MEEAEHILVIERRIVKGYKVKVQYQRLEKERSKVRRKEISGLAAYYIVAASSFVLFPYLDMPFAGMRLVVSIAVVILSTIVIWFATYIGTKRGWKEALVVCTGIPALLATLFLSWFTTASLDVRYVFSAFFVAGFVGTFNFVLYFDNVSHSGEVNGELLHSRYLEYERTFFWIILITVTAYITWEFAMRGPSYFENSSASRIGLLGLLQLVIVFGNGAAIVFVAFDRKLRQIERLTKQD